MDSWTIIEQHYTKAFNDIHDLWEADLLDECEDQAWELLEERAMPHSHRIKTLLILSTILEDWHKAERCYREAERLWQMVRLWYSVGRDADVNRFMAELRMTLDDVVEVLDREEP